MGKQGGIIILLTYQDFLNENQSEDSRTTFALNAILQHKSSSNYKTAVDAEDYANGKNVTISKYQKLLYTIEGDAVPDNYTANHKTKSGFFKLFVTQEVAVQLGNGVRFEKEETKKKLGKKFDSRLYMGAKSALIDGVSFAFFDLDKVNWFKLTEFVPLYDEETGALMAGIRFWQIDEEKPLRFTIYEIDGFQDYIASDDEHVRALNRKRSYKLTLHTTIADGTEIVDGQNYPGFPIIPLYGNPAKQSELIGLREQIDCYDLIKSGFANDLDDVSMIYWTITNAGGMEEEDLAKFRESMKRLKVSVVDAYDSGTKVESHTMDVPYESRQVYLENLKNDLYRFAMAANVERISAGDTTATEIEAAYEPLNEKLDEFEMCLYEFFDQLFNIAEIDDTPKFERSYVVNQTELTQNILSAASVLDTETILRKLPFVSVDEVEEIIKRKQAEEMSRTELTESIDTNDENGKNKKEGDE